MMKELPSAYYNPSTRDCTVVVPVPPGVVTPFTHNAPFVQNALSTAIDHANRIAVVSRMIVVRVIFSDGVIHNLMFNLNTQ